MNSKENNYCLELLAAESIARRAGLFVVKNRAQGFDLNYKGQNDIVTSLDVASEALIKRLIYEAFPEDEVAGEETGAAKPAHSKSSATPSKSTESQTRCWLIDPIDGTLNFSTGVPFYCISVALQVDGKSVVGAIFDPNRDELFSAVKGGGAFLNGEPISVSECDDFAKAVLVTGFPPGKADKYNNLDNFTKLCQEARAVRRLGAAALDLCYVAAGRLDGFWEFNLKPWDTGAGYLIVEEAGGRVTNNDGDPYLVSHRSIVATNGHIHQRLAGALTPCEID